MNIIRALSISLFSLLFALSLQSSASEDIKFESIHGQSVTQKFVPWQKAVIDRLKSYHETLKKVEAHVNRERNLATFKVTLKIGNQSVEHDFQNVIFVSGLNTALSENLKSRFEGCNKVACPGDYCRPEPNKPSDYGLRQNIVEFFDFEEDLYKQQQTKIQNDFAELIGNSDFFEGFILKKPSINKLNDALKSVICMKYFDKKSNTKAKKLGLLDKAQKGSDFTHIDDLFRHFKLNFADSEQAIRLFICDLPKKNIFDLSTFDFKDPAIQALKEKCGTFKCINESQKKKQKRQTFGRRERSIGKHQQKHVKIC